MKALRLMVVALPFLAAAGPLSAALFSFHREQVDTNGTGFGNVLNVLTVQANGSEYGSVLLDGSGQEVLGGDAKNNSQTVSVLELAGIGVDATNFGVVLNLSQAGTGGGTPIDLHAFSFRLYTDPDDLSQFFDATFTPGGSNASSNGLAPILGNGTGSAGWLFHVSLSTAEATAFFGNNDNRVGAFINPGDAITGSDDGQENFYVADVGGLAEVPEPATLAILGLGGSLLLGSRHRRRGAAPSGRG